MSDNKHNSLAVNLHIFAVRILSEDPNEMNQE